jgi:DNA-binding transcriptional LysR family regulator
MAWTSGARKGFTAMTSPSSDKLGIEPNHLVYFACIVRHESFTGAAKETGVSKSKLSRVVSNLENQAGVRLLERTTRRVTLTDAGCLLYQRCQEVYAASVATHATIEAIKGVADMENHLKPDGRMLVDP